MANTNPEKLTDPYTRERAQQLHRSYLQRNSIGLSIMCIGHVVLGLLYGDPLLTLYFGLFVLSGFAYGLYSEKIKYDTFVYLGEILIIIGIVGSQFVMPQGASCDVLLFPLGATLLAFSQTLFRGVLVFSIGLGLFFLFPILGFYSPEVAIVPEFLSFALNLLYFIVVLTLQVNKARNSVNFALSSLVDIENELTEKEAALKGYEQNLSEINTELDSSNAELANTLKKEHTTNEQLDTDRVKQEGINKAIYRDLKNPLQIIKSESEALKDLFDTLPSSKPVAPYLDFAIDGAERMDKMLDDLLAYTKGDVGQVLEPVNLNEITSILRRDLLDLIERSNATFECQNLPTIMGFSTQLTQLFQNLVSNALKFSRVGVPPKVEIYPAERQDKEGFYMIRVRDNGVGIPANQLDSVFGLFNRAHSEEGYEGSGIGLALCRRIAVAHGAELTVASVPNEGTQFTISFPITSVTKIGSDDNTIPVNSKSKVNELF